MANPPAWTVCPCLSCWPGDLRPSVSGPSAPGRPSATERPNRGLAVHRGLPGPCRGRPPETTSRGDLCSRGSTQAVSVLCDCWQWKGTAWGRPPEGRALRRTRAPACPGAEAAPRAGCMPGCSRRTGAGPGGTAGCAASAGPGRLRCAGSFRALRPSSCPSCGRSLAVCEWSLRCVRPVSRCVQLVLHRARPVLHRVRPAGAPAPWPPPPGRPPCSAPEHPAPPSVFSFRRPAARPQSSSPARPAPRSAGASLRRSQGSAPYRSAAPGGLPGRGPLGDGARGWGARPGGARGGVRA